jgi:lipid-A-disaccharide synthase
MSKKFFIIAGEPSGDIIGAKIIEEIKIQMAKRNEECLFVGIGGQNMISQGLESLFKIDDLSVMGFSEVLPHIIRLLNMMVILSEKMAIENPDYIITIDAPDFNFRLIKKFIQIAPNHKAKKIHLIAPSVWAYRKGRAKKIAKLYDLLLAILPFEPPYFQKHGLPTIFIGHPIIEDAPDFSKKAAINSEFRKKYGLKDSNIVILVTPGSRISEVKRIFPEFIATINLLAKEIPNLKILIPVVSKTKQMVESLIPKIEVKSIIIEQEEKTAAFFVANYALAKSGTNTLELSLFQIPMIIAYKISKISHFIAKLLIKIKFANIINLILNKELIKEMLQENCQPSKMAKEMMRLINDKDLAAKQIAESQIALKILGLGSNVKAAKKAATEILLINN